MRECKSRFFRIEEQNASRTMLGVQFHRWALRTGIGKRCITRCTKANLGMWQDLAMALKWIHAIKVVEKS
jgi:hypothetical protein